MAFRAETQGRRDAGEEEPIRDFGNRRGFRRFQEIVVRTKNEKADPFLSFVCLVWFVVNVLSFSLGLVER
jgi:hypothetical protein